MSAAVLRVSHHSHSSTYWLSSGQRVLVAVTTDGESDHTHVFLDGKELDGDELDGEASLVDAYASIDVPFKVVMGWREEVFGRFLRVASR